MYLYAKLTPNAVKSLPKPDDQIDVSHLSVCVMGTPPMRTEYVNLREKMPLVRKDLIWRLEYWLSGMITPAHEILQLPKDSISDEIQVTHAKIEQMASIIGANVSRDVLANFLDGAGGDVQVALEHYFMSTSSAESSSMSTHKVTASSAHLVKHIQTPNTEPVSMSPSGTTSPSLGLS